MPVATVDLEGFAESLNSIATDAALEPDERIAELRRVKAEILADRDEAGRSPEYPDLTALAGHADTYIGNLELQREAATMQGHMEVAAVRENADVRDVLISMGIATPEELDQAGWPSHDELDSMADEGTLSEAAFGLALNFAEDKVKRDHGKFAKKSVPGDAPGMPAPKAAKAASAPKALVQRGAARKPLPTAPAAPIKPTAPAAAAAAPASQRAELDGALKTMFRPEETVKPEQHFGSPEKLFDAAGKDFPGFEEMLTGGLAGDMGALTPGSLEDAVTNSERDPGSPQVVMGPMKEMDRAKEKVDTKYDGNWDKLQDVLRATVVVPSLEHMPAAVEAIRKHAEANGWQVRKAENRFSDPPPPHNVGPTPAGYRDSAVALVSPSGVVSELQINTAAMFQAKQGEGHKLYEQSRGIEAAVKQRSGGMASPGTEGPTDDELRQLADIETRSKALYQQAYEASYA